MPNFPEEITNAQHPKDQIVYKNEDAVNKKKAIGLMAQLKEILM